MSEDNLIHLKFKNPDASTPEKEEWLKKIEEKLNSPEMKEELIQGTFDLLLYGFDEALERFHKRMKEKDAGRD